MSDAGRFVFGRCTASHGGRMPYAMLERLQQQAQNQDKLDRFGRVAAGIGEAH